MAGNYILVLPLIIITPIVLVVVFILYKYVKSTHWSDGFVNEMIHYAYHPITEDHISMYAVLKSYGIQMWGISSSSGVTLNLDKNMLVPGQVFNGYIWRHSNSRKSYATPAEVIEEAYWGLDLRGELS